MIFVFGRIPLYMPLRRDLRPACRPPAGRAGTGREDIIEIRPKTNSYLLIMCLIQFFNSKNPTIV
ncbi:MAG: hypothetical protein BRD50_02450 [Bacteroidetes bacterium SW_11_45_7]|nr:MAG: hypothetical protein BRD50_02450 [Bacteroidetes bacterium SW_11_45_7]